MPSVPNVLPDIAFEKSKREAFYVLIKTVSFITFAYWALAAMPSLFVPLAVVLAAAALQWARLLAQS